MKKMETNLALVLILVLIFGGFFIYYIITQPKLREYNKMKLYEAEREKNELRYQAATSLYYPPNWNKKTDGQYFNYDLRSWDGGKNWYAVEFDNNWGMKILGDVKLIYPNLLEHIEGMNALYKFVKENGAIDGTNPKGIEALEKAGFTVKTKE